MAFEGDGETFTESEFDRILQMALARCRLRFDTEVAKRSWGVISDERLDLLRDTAFAEPILSTEIGNAARVYVQLRGPTPPHGVPGAAWILDGQDLVAFHGVTSK
jgi:hypothetical protein